MSNRLPILNESNAPETTKSIFAQLRRDIGMVPNIYATVGASASALQSLLAWGAALGKSKLSKREIEQINLHIADLNGCAYCVSAHSALGGAAGLSAAEIEAARAGQGANERENALLAFARRVIRTGGARAGGDLVRLREAGVSDAEVIDLIAAVFVRSFVNAVAIVAQTEVDFPKAARLPAD